MKVEELEKQALALSAHERTALVAKLLHTLPPVDSEIPDSEVEQRERDLDSGNIAAISSTEFVRRVQQERSRAAGVCPSSGTAMWSVRKSSESDA